MRTQAEWNVANVSSLPFFPTSARTRLRITRAALFVKVTAMMLRAATPFSMSRAIRCVTTRVFPDPGPASTRSGPFA